MVSNFKHYKSLFSDPFFGNRFGRDNFQEAMKIAQRMKPSEVDWKKFKYIVYDIPNHTGTYQERFSRLGKESIITLFVLPFSFIFRGIHE